MTSKVQLLKQVEKDILALKTSPLYSYRQKNNYLPVPGEGNSNSKVVFIGEAPGKNEALTGKPFTGAAGRILNDLLASIDLKREDVFITSVVKDRPPENRDPSPKEIALYTPFLIRQLDIIKPKVIVTLGRYALNTIWDEFKINENREPIGKAHGQSISITVNWGKTILLPLYHPAVILYNNSSRDTLYRDFQILKKLL